MTNRDGRIASPVFAITQARMSSSRLPSKVLLPIAGKPMLWWHLSRLKLSQRLDGIVVAIADEPGNQAIIDIAQSLDIPSFVGSVDDVLARFVGAARSVDAMSLVRITSDCPLIDPVIIDRLIDIGLKPGSPYDYLRMDTDSYPRGFDCELLSRSTLELAEREALLPSEREHVTPFIWSRPERFALYTLPRPQGPMQGRYCVDTEADLALVRAVIEGLGSHRIDFDAEEIFRFVAAHPDLAMMNAHIAQKLV